MARKKRSKLPTGLSRSLLLFARKANYWLIARFAMAALWSLRKLPADKALDFAAWVAKKIGPRFGRHRTAVDNLRRAYPEKSPEEIDAIAMEMWDNMARLAAEYIFLDQLFDFDPDDRSAGRVQIVGEELHPMGRVKDFAPYASKILSSGAQAVITGNWGNDLTLLVKAAREAGFNGTFYTFYGNALGAPAAIGAGGP